MAEAAVEDSATNRFYCHECSIEITRVLEDYRCPTCRGGFIEELDSTNTSSDEPSDDHTDDEMDDFFSDVQNPFEQFLFERTGGRGNQDRDARNPDGEPVDGDGTGTRYRSGNYLNLNLRPRDGNIFGRYTNSIEHTIQDFIVNLTGIGWGPMAPAGPNDQVFFLGNPGDYAWGREGLDAIITQLLNQMDVTGPPPLDKEKIREIPVTVIEQEQVDSNLQCSVCWDDFKVGEAVRKLECEHFYHESCIVPWLELHGTCPICRKQLLNDQKEKTPFNGGNNSSRSNLAAMIHAVRSRASTNMRSGSSSSANSTSTSNSNPSNGRQPPPPSSDYQMDLEYDQS